MSTIGDALALRADGDGRWLAHADPDHQSITGMFGGWTAGVLLGAVIRTADGTAMPSAMTVNYIGPISPDDDVVVTVEHLGGGRSINQWRADVRPVAGDALFATAVVALTHRRPSTPHQQLQMPDAPDPDSQKRIYAPSPQGLHSDLRHVSGSWNYESGDSRDSMWVRDVSGRPLDHLQLAYFADQYAPRSFFFGGGPGPSATISMSVYSTPPTTRSRPWATTTS